MNQSLPELRSNIIAGILQHVAETPGAVSYSAVFDRALAATGLTEEEVSQDTLHATSHLILSGLLLSNRFDEDMGEITFAHDTNVVAGRRLLGFVWDESLPTAEEDEGEDA
ncbi:MAG: hypothetical protein DCF30_15860 [Hyphomicrobiales bacterium]|nr:MAG: hypothetical protein DCF30_15860 [Hyphomicrobiales bacterium]